MEIGSMSYGMPMEGGGGSSSGGNSGKVPPSTDGSGGVSGTTGGGGGDGGDNNDGSDVYKKCGISEQRRSDALLEILSSVSSNEALTDMSTSQYKARYWLDKDDTAMLCPGDGENDTRVLQRYIAGLIYFQFNGDNWDNCGAYSGSCFQEDSTSVPAIPFLDQAIVTAQEQLEDTSERQRQRAIDTTTNFLINDLFGLV